MKAKNVLTSVCFLRHFGRNNVQKDFDARFNNFVKQAAMNEKYGIRPTYMPEYDALILPNYQEKLLAEREKNGAEIGFWFEVVKPLGVALAPGLHLCQPALVFKIHSIRLL